MSHSFSLIYLCVRVHGHVYTFMFHILIFSKYIYIVSFYFQDELARVFVTLFDAKHLLSPLLWNMFYREVEVSDCMQTLFRGNSLGSKIMAFCFKIYGASYLQNLLEPLIRPLLEESNQSFEVDPARFVIHP